MGVEATIEGGNKRIVQLRQMLAKPFSGTAKMVAHVVGNPPLPFGEWTVAELVPALADTLETEMCEALEASTRPALEFMFAFIAEDGRSLKVKSFELRKRINIENVEALAASMDGSDRASTMLAQQTALSLTRVNIASIQQVVQTLADHARHLQSGQQANDARTDAAREAQHEALELLVELRAAQQEAASTPEPSMSPAQEQFWKLAAAHLPIIAARLLGGGDGGGGNR
jgi:hypothetical protein